MEITISSTAIIIMGLSMLIGVIIGRISKEK